MRVVTIGKGPIYVPPGKLDPSEKVSVNFWSIPTPSRQVFCTGCLASTNNWLNPATWVGSIVSPVILGRLGGTKSGRPEVVTGKGSRFTPSFGLN